MTSERRTRVTATDEHVHEHAHAHAHEHGGAQQGSRRRSVVRSGGVEPRLDIFVVDSRRTERSAPTPVLLLKATGARASAAQDAPYHRRDTAAAPW
jgi:hypothetical protein